MRYYDYENFRLLSKTTVNSKTYRSNMFEKQHE